MQSISTNNLFMHGHEKWGKATLLVPTWKSGGGDNCRLAPAISRSMRIQPAASATCLLSQSARTLSLQWLQ